MVYKTYSLSNFILNIEFVFEFKWCTTTTQQFNYEK